MLMDKQVMVHDHVDYDATDLATPVAFDLGNVNPGHGNKIKFMLHCAHGDLAGLTALTITDCATSGGSYAAHKVITALAATVNAGPIFFEMDVTDCARYVKFAFTGISAGTGITLAAVMDEQTNI